MTGGMPEPRVLIIGQSISLGYTPYVQRLLRQRGIVVEHNPGNAGQASNILMYLDDWALSGSWDLIQLTAGLHELLRDRQTGRPRAEVEDFASHVEQIVVRLRQGSSARLLWATTTPVIDQRHATSTQPGDRFERDQVRYSRAAQDIMRRYGVPINDLHAAVMSAGAERLIGPDGVHFTEEGYAFLGEKVAERIVEELARASG